MIVSCMKDRYLFRIRINATLSLFGGQRMRAVSARMMMLRRILENAFLITKSKKIRTMVHYHSLMDTDTYSTR